MKLNLFLMALVALVTITFGGCLGTTSSLSDADKDFLGGTINTAKEEAVTKAAEYTNTALDSVGAQVAESLENINKATAAAHAHAEAAHARAESAETSARSYTDEKIDEVRKEIAKNSPADDKTKDVTRSRYSPGKTKDVTRSRYSPDEPDAKVYVGEGALAGAVLHNEYVSFKNAKNPLASINQNDARIIGLDGMLGLEGEEMKSIHIGENGAAFSVRHAAEFGLKGTKNPLVSYNQKGARISRNLALAQAWHNAKHKFLGKDGKAFVLENKQEVDVTGTKNPIVSIQDLDVTTADE